MIIIALLTIITILSESFSPRVRETPCVGPRESAGHDLYLCQTHGNMVF